MGHEADARWVIPSEDEWYKAAYHKNDGVTGNYWDFPTGSDTAPTSEPPPGTDMTNGSANYNYAIDSPYYRTKVRAYDAKPSDSPYGTFDQGGNVWEWNEAVVYGSSRGLRSGSFGSYDDFLHAAYRNNFQYPTFDFDSLGFRVAKVPDCNTNGMSDSCDLDCGTNGGPCDVTDCGLSFDCNTNGVPDECDLAGNDCNTNSIPDECEADTDEDGVIDDCDNCTTNGNPDQADFDGDGAGDACDDDIDEDGVLNGPDVCDYTPLGAANIIMDPTSSLYGTIRRDLDGDCDCDLADFAKFAEDGLTGPNP